MSSLATNRAPSGAAGARPAKRRVGLPDVDERLVMPETRFEVLDGKVEFVAPSDEPHGSRHSKISALLEAYAASGYDVASDMLTRTSAKNDLAPDASVFPAARDPRTGGRQIEELAFEVLSTERVGHAAKKARALTDRGVRRVFAIDVERKRALVWSTTTNTWEMLPLDSAIDDRALALPLPLRALVEAISSDDAVAQALLVKKNPVITRALASAERKGKTEGKAEGRREGKAEGRREGERKGAIKGAIKTLLAVLAARGLTVRKKHEKLIRSTDTEAVLAAWIVRAVSCASVDELLAK
jgi:Uma2 family endonuclease